MRIRSRALRRTGGPLLLALALGLAAAAAAGCRSSSAEIAAADPPLSALYESPEALAKAFLDALEVEDVETLKSFALSEEEFRHHVWPALPSSRPERGLPFEYGWNDLHQKSLNSLARTYGRYRGRRLELLEIRIEGETTDYGAFLLHRDARVKVRTETGEEAWLDLFGSVLEREGEFKLFSYVTD